MPSLFLETGKQTPSHFGHVAIFDILSATEENGLAVITDPFSQILDDLCCWFRKFMQCISYWFEIIIEALTSVICE